MIFIIYMVLGNNLVPGMVIYLVPGNLVPVDSVLCMSIRSDIFAVKIHTMTSKLIM